MVQVSAVLRIVKKTTGGKLWNKPWGLPPLTRTQKANKSKGRKAEQKVDQVLREAAVKEPSQDSLQAQRQS
ncbi:hypothetical protein WJX75_000089 [Coccomyxa subellipsoidea]|uniref:Uncharacterized protein n=1 Tax=Coccomyxa subellipsoidea TaxID=248742 RepID=A0ABR2YFR9_9CHLO